MDDNKSLKVTPLYEIHKEMNARMAPFGGFEMPIQYTGILEEHSAAREGAAIFDTCHMGEFIISGSESQKDLERLLSCSISAIEQNRCKYGFITNPQGGVIDDMIIYRKGDLEFLMVVNAGTREKDYNWISENISEGTEVRDISENTAKIDIQGPKAPEIIEKMVDRPVQGLKFFEFMENTIGDTEILLSRTGYTGEVGFEIFCNSGASEPIWRKATELEAVPAGLGCRDTLRLEMALPLYGHELDESRNPRECGYPGCISDNKDFIGSEIINNPENIKEKLCGIVIESRRAAREREAVVDRDGEKIGYITSGSYSPTLKQAIALAYIKKDSSALGTTIYIDKGRKKLRGEIVEMPFYKEATGRKKLSRFLNT